jgi:hypothetical protein
MDLAWWQHHVGEVSRTFTGERVTIRKMLHRFGCTWEVGLPPYGNSGAGAVSLAARRGARRVILLGYDLAYRGALRHWHGAHPKGLGDAGSLGRWPGQFAQLRRQLDRDGVDYVNCSRRTALDWPQATLESTLC